MIVRIISDKSIWINNVLIRLRTRSQTHPRNLIIDSPRRRRADPLKQIQKLFIPLFHQCLCGFGFGSVGYEFKPRLTQRVSIWPSPSGWVVVPITVTKQVRLLVLKLGREPEGVGLRHRPGGTEEFPEGAFKASPDVLAKALPLRKLGAKAARAGFSEAGP
jgi:hypothetical protein